MALPDPSFFSSWQAYAQALNTELSKVYGVSGEDVVNSSEEVRLGDNVYSEDGSYVITDYYVNNQYVPVGGNILPDWNFELTAAAGFGTEFSGNFWQESTTGVTVDTSGENSSRALSFDVAGGVARSTLAFPVSSGEVIHFAWKHFRPTSYTGNLTLQVRRLDASSALIATTTVEQNGGSENTWNTTTAQYTVPSGTFFLQVEVVASTISPSAPSVNWIWAARTEYQATEGALAGTNLYGEAGQVLSDLDVRNDQAVVSELSSINFNPSFQQQRRNSNGDLAPAGWFRTNSAAGTSIGYESDTTRDILDINGGRAVNSAIRVNQDTTYEVVIRWRDASGPTSVADLLIAEYDSDDMGDGKVAVGTGTAAGAEDEVVEDTREITLVSNRSLTTSYTVDAYDYTPTATAKWASIAIASGGSDVRVDWAVLREKSTRNTGTLADLDSVDSAQVTVGALTSMSRADQGNTTVSTATTWTEVGSMTVDVGTDPSNVAALVSFFPSDGQYRDSRTSGGYLISVDFRVQVDGTTSDTALISFGGPTVYGSETRCFNPTPVRFLVPGSDLSSGNNQFDIDVYATTNANFTSYSTGNASYMTVEIFKRT